MSRLRTLMLRADDGAATVEMALFAPFFAAMLIGMVDISSAYAAKLQLQQAAQRAVEKIEQTSASTTVIATLTAEAATAAGVAASAVTVDYWLECNGSRQLSYGTVCTPGQTYARYLTVHITKDFSPPIKFKFPNSNSDGTYTITTKAGIRTQ